MTNDWFKNLSPEKKAEVRQKQREKYNSVTPEQKAERKRKRKEYEQKHLSKLPPEEQERRKQANLDRLRKYCNSLSPEDYKKLRKKITDKSNRKIYASLTPEDIEKRKLYIKQWYANFGSERLTKERERRKQEKLELKKLVIGHYSNGSMRCVNPNCEVPGGAKNLMALSIDHINGGGRKHLKEINRTGSTNLYRWLVHQGFPQGFQTLCMNCQFIKKLTNKEDQHKS